MPNDIVVISEIGPQGATGTAATVAVGTVAASAPGATPTITNAGTPTAAVFNFTLPRGETGPDGPQGTTDYNDLTNKPDAVLRTGNQTIAGVKQFTDTILGNTTPLANDTGRYPLRFGKDSGWGFLLTATTYGNQTDVAELCLFAHNFDRSIPLRPYFGQRWEANYDISHAVGHPYCGSLSELYFEWQAPTGSDNRVCRPMYMTISQPASSCQRPQNYSPTNYSGKTKIDWWVNEWNMGRRFKDNLASPPDEQFRYCVKWDMDGDAVGDGIPTLYLQGNHKLDVEGNTRLRSQLILSGRADATIAGDQNNWAPTGATTASQIYVNGGAGDRNLTGLAGGVAGRILGITNTGTTNNIVLVNASASSTAANRFALPANVTLQPGTSIELRYDGTAAVWRPNALANVTVSSITGFGNGVPAALALAAGDASGSLVRIQDMARFNVVPVPLSSANAAATGGNGSNGSLGHFEMQQSVTAGSSLSFARRSIVNLISLSGLAAVNFDKVVGFQIGVDVRQVSSSSALVFSMSGAFGADGIGTVGRPTQRGLGLEIRNQTLFRIVHDGTTSTATSTGLSVRVLNTSPFGGTNIITCMMVGPGSFQFWLNGVDAGISTLGPTGLSSAQWSPDYVGLAFSLDTGGNTGAHSVFWRSCRLFQQQ